MWSKGCSHSYQCTQGYPERTDTGDERGSWVAALLRRWGCGGEGRDP
jgi:hypothetical protein